MIPLPRLEQVPRTKLGAMWAVAVRQRVYRIPDGIEIDDVENYQVRRKRIFFDDILLITHHRHIGAAFVAFMIVNILLWGGLSLLLMRDNLDVAAAIFALVAAMFLLVLVTRLLFRLDVVTIFGRRTKAVMFFRFRKERAREIFEEIRGAAAAHQRRIAERIAREKAQLEAEMQPPEEFPLPPEMP